MSNKFDSPPHLLISSLWPDYRLCKHNANSRRAVSVMWWFTRWIDLLIDFPSKQTGADLGIRVIEAPKIATHLHPWTFGSISIHVRLVVKLRARVRPGPILETRTSSPLRRLMQALRSRIQAYYSMQTTTWHGLSYTCRCSRVCYVPLPGTPCKRGWALVRWIRVWSPTHIIRILACICILFRETV